jgi:hypothetical protein
MSRSDRPAPQPGTPDHLSGHHYGDPHNAGGHGSPGHHDDRDDRGEGFGRGRMANVDWDQYDVPRIWQMVANEGSTEAEGLVWAFYVVSQFVDDTRLRLLEAGKALALGWSGAPASNAAQALTTEITDAMVRDTANYVTATRELEQIVARLTESKQAVQPHYEQYMRLQRLAGDSGIFATTVTESDVYRNELEHVNVEARNEMRRLDRDLEGARVTTTDDFLPSTGVPTPDDLQLAGLGPQAIEAAHGGGAGRGMLSGGGGLPPTAAVVPGGGGLGGVGGGVGAVGPMRPAMPGVIGGDPSGARPMGGMMGAGMMGGAGAHGAGGEGGGGGRADTQWETRHGVNPVIDGTTPSKPKDGRG